MLITNEEIIALISKMSIIELNDLVKDLENKFNVSSNMLISSNSSNNISKEKIKKEEKTEFNVTLIDIGIKKIAVIKVIREITGLGLKASKDLVDSAPKIIKESVSKVVSEEIKKKLEDVGAKVEIK